MWFSSNFAAESTLGDLHMKKTISKTTLEALETTPNAFIDDFIVAYATSITGSELLELYEVLELCKEKARKDLKFQDFKLVHRACVQRQTYQTIDKYRR